MPILGVNGLNGTYHDSAACLILDDGTWVSVEEERLNRIKHTSGFPARATQWCLDEYGITSDCLDAVGFFLDTETHYARYFLKPVIDYPAATDDFFRHGVKLFSYWRDRLSSEMAHCLGVDESRVIQVSHHLAHACSVYYLSPFDEAAVLTVDGAGDAESAAYFHATGADVRPLAYPLVFPKSLGLLYNAIATHLGLGSQGAAGKLMGLAPYGRPTLARDLARVIAVPQDAAQPLRFDLSYVEYHLGGGRPSLAPALVEIIGPPRPTEAPILQHHADVAASVQRVLEDAVVFLAKQLRAMTGSRRLCYAGGVALNIDANARIKDEAGFEEIAITPSAYDAGTSIGAALYLHHTRFGRSRVAPLAGAYKGPQYGDAAIADAFRAAGLTPERVADPAEAAALLLAGGAVIGWFQGREEIGPRALGNRSILMDPGVPDGKALINARVKFREAFRPFAPSVPLDEAGRYFEDVCASPYMLYKFPVRPEWRGRLGAITHVDGSARVHTVSEPENALFYELLKAFGRRRGYGVLLNTSFNVQGQPLVSTPAQAIAVYLQTRMDALVIGPFVVRREIAADADVARRTLEPGVIDPGGAPRGPVVESRPRPVPYPDGIAITNAEAAAFDSWLADCRRAAAEGPYAALLSAMLREIAELEDDVWRQSRAGVEHLVGLWQALARTWLDRNRVHELTENAVRDTRLLERGPFPPD